LTSEQKLARILAMRFLRGVLQQHKGIMDFHTMCTLVGSHDITELSAGEAGVLARYKEILTRPDDSFLEQEMKALDEFKISLKQEVDDLVDRLKIGLAG
jgi:ABC-type iron transport system FetAB ATPase subunit